jgi:uncharacterized MnhB-related membrane protein
MLEAVLVAGAILCALLAIRAQRLLASALWLAGVSVLTSIMVYLMGAVEVAVIELSVGTGLVTVLFVFAVSVTGEQECEPHAVVPRALSWTLVGLAVVLLAVNVLPVPAPLGGTGGTLATMLWMDRSLDVLVQIVLLFSGVLGVLGLLSDSTTQNHSTEPVAQVEDAPVDTWALESATASQPEQTPHEEVHA